MDEVMVDAADERDRPGVVNRASTAPAPDFMSIDGDPLAALYLASVPLWDLDGGSAGKGRTPLGADGVQAAGAGEGGLSGEHVDKISAG